MSGYFKIEANLETFLKTELHNFTELTQLIHDTSLSTDQKLILTSIMEAKKALYNSSIENAIAIYLGKTLKNNPKEIETVVRKVCSFMLERKNPHLRSSLETAIEHLPSDKQKYLDSLIWKHSPTVHKSGDNWGYVHRYDDLGLLYDLLHDKIGGDAISDSLNQAGISLSPIPTPQLSIQSSPIPSNVSTHSHEQQSTKEYLLQAFTLLCNSPHCSLTDDQKSFTKTTISNLKELEDDLEAYEKINEDLDNITLTVLLKSPSDTLIDSDGFKALVKIQKVYSDFSQVYFKKGDLSNATKYGKAAGFKLAESIAKKLVDANLNLRNETGLQAAFELAKKIEKSKDQALSKIATISPLSDTAFFAAKYMISGPEKDKALDCIVDAQLAAKNADQAFTVAKQMGTGRDQTFSKIVTLCLSWDIPDTNTAFSAAKYMISGPERDKALANVARAFKKSGEFLQSKHAIRQMSSYSELRNQIEKEIV